MNSNFSKLLIIFLLITACTSGETLDMQENSDKPAPTLNCTLHGKEMYLSDDSVELSFNLHNPTDADVWFLPWSTPYEGVFNDMFIVSLNGSNSINYHGPMIKRAKPVPADFIRLKAKDILEMKFNLSKSYNLSAIGTYQINYKMQYLQTRKSNSDGSSSEGLISVQCPPISFITQY